MAVFVVTWNLNREGANYDTRRAALIKQIEKYVNKSDPGLESVRWIQATTAEELSKDLLQRLDKNDRLFVAQLHRGYYYGYLDNAVWDWISPKL